MLPLRRLDNLLIEELPGETLVYDRARFKGHCLNRATALIWKHCDGKTTVTELAELLRREMQTPVDEDVVRLALHHLDKAHLLREFEGGRPAKCSRRDVVRKAARCGIAAAAMVATVAIPTPAEACTGLNQPCLVDADCCAGLCCKRTGAGSCTCKNVGGGACLGPGGTC